MKEKTKVRLQKIVKVVAFPALFPYGYLLFKRYYRFSRKSIGFLLDTYWEKW